MFSSLKPAFRACTKVLSDIKNGIIEWHNAPSLTERTPWDAIAEHSLFEKFLDHLDSVGENTETMRPAKPPPGKVRVEFYNCHKNVKLNVCSCWEYIDLLPGGELDWVQLRDRFGLSATNCAIMDSANRPETQTSEMKMLSPLSVYILTDGHTKPLRLIEPRWSAIVDCKRAVRLLMMVLISFFRLLFDLVIWRIHYEEYEFEFPLPEELAQLYWYMRMRLPYKTVPAYSSPQQTPQLRRLALSESFIEEQAVARYLLKPLRRLAQDSSFSTRVHCAHQP